jgi:hypothetical protein
MKALRFVAILLPQLLLLMTIAGQVEMLRAWTGTDAAFGTLLLLILAAPLVALVWLVAELIRRRVRRRRGEAPTPAWPAALVLTEALCLDLVLLSQVRM